MNAGLLTFVTDPIELDVINGQPVTIKHGLGRQVAGWLCIWKSAQVDFYVVDAAADTARELALMPTATASVRLVLL